jgi:peptide deformylase
MPKVKGQIVQVGDPVLRQVAKPVPKKDFGTPMLKRIVARLRKAMQEYGEYGVAIAAPQIGISLRIFVISARAFSYMDKEDGMDEKKEYSDRVFINPELSRLSRGKHMEHEGCMSVHGTFGWVKRHDRASIKAHDVEGKVFTYHGSGLIAHIFQHEVDHLDGILFIDKAERLEEKEGKE